MNKLKIKNNNKIILETDNMNSIIKYIEIKKYAHIIGIYNNISINGLFNKKQLIKNLKIN